MRPYGGSELEALQCARNYYRWIAGRMRPHLRGRCLEIGAGIGTFTGLLAGMGLEEVVAAEPSPDLYRHLCALASKNGIIKPVNMDLEGLVSSAAGAFDCIVMVNVLEHIEDDRRAVSSLLKVMKPQGRLCVFVPAVPSLYGSLDREFEHFRRYSARSLSELAVSSRFEPVLVRHMNMPGVVSWWFMAKVLRLRKWSPAGVRAFDMLCIPVIRILESLFSPPVGQSILIVCRPA